MKIRNSGGAGQAWRARFVGAIPNTTAWPNVPLALSQGTFDGLVSSNESLVSAKLWESGVKYALRGSPVHRRIHSRGQPGVLGQAGARPAEDDDGDLGAERSRPIATNMAAAQTKARKTLEEHGVKLSDPTAGAERRRSASG